MQIDLETLGLDKEKLAELVVDRVVEQLLSSYDVDEDGQEGRSSSRFKDALQGQIKERINSSVAELAEKHLMPKLQEGIDGLILQETSKWGEKTGAPISFVDYMVQRAENYIREEVNHDGQSKAEARDSYGFNGKTTRITYLINRHLQYHIQTAVKEALDVANKAIIGGLERAVKMKLEEVSKTLTLAVATK